MSRQLQLAPYGAFHRNVRNPIAGLGDLRVFDNSAYYGSAGVLRSVEFYPSARFGVTSTSTHEIGHQWVDFWDWSALSGGVELAGHEPEGHTPLLYPGEVYAGAVLSVTRRVAAVADGAAADGATFAIERTPSPALQHPTTRYRMGLIGPARPARLREPGTVQREQLGRAGRRDRRRRRLPRGARQRHHGRARRT